MCLGDSITYNTLGRGDPTWPDLLEEMLRRERIDVEVINASMPDNNIQNLIDRFEREYISFRPDFLILYKGYRS